MLPGKDKIIQCPACDHKFRQQTIMSGNTLGAKIWTDGKQEAPMLPEGIVLSFCNNCNQYLWVEDAEVIEELDPWDDTVFILRQIWWKYNDYYRKNNEAELSKKI